MKLGHLLEYIKYSDIAVIDSVTDQVIARYDGRNSIDPELNSLDVEYIFGANDNIQIVVSTQ